MKLDLSVNIRNLRKARGLTQEQLAEILGVTVGAVSKWESGSTTPDLMLILAMADFFELSVDVLLGYELRSHSLGDSVRRIKEQTNKKAYEEGVREAEKALLKYPYAFDVVYYSARLFGLKGMEQQRRRDSERALMLYEEANKLIHQNNDPEISKVTIQKGMANVYLQIGQEGKALEMLKACNVEGLNDAAIGYILATRESVGKGDEALPYLSSALRQVVAELFRIVLGLVNVYMEREDYHSAREITEWLQGITAGLRLPEKVSFLDKMDVMLYMVMAFASLADGQDLRAMEALKRAEKQAERFDSSPDYGSEGIKFYEGGKEAFAFDSFGETAREGIERMIRDESKPEFSAQIKQLWEAINHD